MKPSVCDVVSEPDQPPASKMRTLALSTMKANVVALLSNIVTVLSHIDEAHYHGPRTAFC